MILKFNDIVFKYFLSIFRVYLNRFITVSQSTFSTKNCGVLQTSVNDNEYKTSTENHYVKGIRSYNNVHYTENSNYTEQNALLSTRSDRLAYGTREMIADTEPRR